MKLNKKAIKVWCAVLPLFFMGLLSAQNKQAEKLLDQMAKSYKEAVTFNMGFDFQMYDENGNAQLGGSGELLASKDRYYLKMKSTEQLFDGKKLYSINKEDQEVIVQTPDMNSDDFLSPTRAISSYKKDFNANMSGDNIKLLPKDKNSGIKEILLITNKKNQLKKFTQHNDDGSKIVINVNTYIENLIIPGSTFRFNKKNYPKYMITDID